ncbi:cytochrome c oxidase subunit 2, mitochondrion [Artemisia annua]|uniref:Cytochrome c oxidase subunit 2, mitochondrion n=1 Tax=Artemisia annua TaxID=35608 RepID=A0A2U1L9M9_ARTAN|nr:cytochrome c oxidase subunit 2, mitochondrion [Artemisia annua]
MYIVSPQRIVHGTTIEILRTIFPSIIPMFIAIPSFALLYSMDEVVVNPAITIKAIGHQWYRSAPLMLEQRLLFKLVGSLASSFGNPILTDEVTNRMCLTWEGRLGFARVLVEISAYKILKEKIEIVYKGKNIAEGTKKVVDLEYAWKPYVCTHCNVFGHDDKRCSYRKTRNEGAENNNMAINNKKIPSDVDMKKWTSRMKRYYKDRKELIDAIEELEMEEDVVDINDKAENTVVKNVVEEIGGNILV